MSRRPPRPPRTDTLLPSPTPVRSAGGGILLYLRQEGRGIGLLNKLRAYALQDQGFDTVDANLRLGFAIDERDFRIAARMLNLLNIDTVRSEEHTSELQSLMRISYAVFCLKHKKKQRSTTKQD